MASVLPASPVHSAAAVDPACPDVRAPKRRFGRSPALPPAVRRRLQAAVAALPETPGVYLWKDGAGAVIYVGKAKRLRRRVLSYLRRRQEDARRAALAADLRDLEWIATPTEVDALALEETLIRQHRPRYNVALVRSGGYPYLRLTLQEPFPRVLVTRSVAPDGAHYIGPFLEPGRLRAVLAAIRQIYPVRTCTWDLPRQAPDRPCLEYDLKRCGAPCVGLESAEHYRAMIGQVTALAEGSQASSAVTALTAAMDRASEALRFEEAARIRDVLRALEQPRRTPLTVLSDGSDHDVVGVARDRSEAAVVVLLVRRGRVVDRRVFRLTVPQGDASAPVGAQGVGPDPAPDPAATSPTPSAQAPWADGELIWAALQELWAETETAQLGPLPPDPSPDARRPTRARALPVVSTPPLGGARTPPAHAPGLRAASLVLPGLDAALAHRLRLCGYRVPSARPGPHPVPAPGATRPPGSPRSAADAGPSAEARVRLPQRGPLRPLIDMATENARHALEDDRLAATPDSAPALPRLDPRVAALQHALGLAAPPRRFVTMDISHGAGRETMASVVTFENGQPRSNAMRTYRLRRLAPGQIDDYASMEEVVDRWAARVGTGEIPRPDLLVIDGGPGQLGRAAAQMQAHGLGDLPIISLAKREELIFRPGSNDPLRLPRRHDGLRLLQHARDEAHRVAVRAHGAAATRRTLASDLGTVPGVGPVRQRRLLQHFGSLSALRAASADAIAAVPGIPRPLATRLAAGFGASEAVAAVVGKSTVGSPPIG